MTDNELSNVNSNWRSNKIWIKNVLSKSGTELMEISRTTKTATTTTTTVVPVDDLQTMPSTSKATTLLTTAKLSNTRNSGVGKRITKKTNGQEPQSKMVYYQSTPLIVKTEQPSQAQFCMPLRTTTTTTTPATSNLNTMTVIPTNYQQQLLPLHAQHQNTITPAVGAGAVTGVGVGATTPMINTYNINHGNDTIILQQHNQQQQQNSSITISSNQSNGHQQHSNFLMNDIKQEPHATNITLYATTHTPSTTTSSQSVQLTTLTPPPTTTKSKATTSFTTTRKNNNNGVPKPQFKCEQCGMIFGSKSAHTSHTKSHAKTAEMTKNNGSGGITTQNNTQLNGIESNEVGGIPKMPQITPNATAGSDPYQCNVCQKTFAVPARLIRHYRTHTGERPFECEFCHKLFSVKENLQVHRRIHTKERPYKCDVCGRAFEHSGKLHRHMRIHTGERPHKCSVCQKTFIQSGQLVIHMRTHTGEKPYKCPVEGCGKGFTCSKQLKVHSRTHTGEKPYHCDICFRDFGYNHVLKLHRVQHYGSKCYKCTICDKTFKSKKEMEAHIKGHANEIPDDEETNAGVVNDSVSSQQASSFSSSGGDTTNSAPASPESSHMIAAVVTAQPKARKPRQVRTPRATYNKSPASPSSPSSTYSPPSSFASATRLSAGSPVSSISSPAPAVLHVSAPASTTSSATTSTLTSASTPTPTQVGNFAAIETEMHYNSRDSDIATNSHSTSNNSCFVVLDSRATYSNIDELPTDLSTTSSSTTNYYNQTNTQPTYTYMHQQQQQQQQQHSPASPVAMSAEPTINPALLEAATIASEDEVTKAALQIMQLHRSTAANLHQIQQQQQSIYVAAPFEDDVQDDDTHEANELIAHYKRGELARHGLHKRYAPVPKFESSLLNNEIIVRQVEAAIAPLRSSTESPERSSSPESDSMLVGDRDVMTLPLRKRKLYMNEEHEHTGNATNGNNVNDSNSNANVANQKVMRMNSVIKFAKAS